MRASAPLARPVPTTITDSCLALLPGAAWDYSITLSQSVRTFLGGYSPVSAVRASLVMDMLSFPGGVLRIKLFDPETASVSDMVTNDVAYLTVKVANDGR